MTKKLPWYKRNPQHWLNATRELTLEERGAYNDLLELMYLRHKPVPDESKFICSFLRVHHHRWSRIRAVLVEGGHLVVRGDYLSNERFERERNIEAEAVAGQRSHGKIRAEAAARDRQGRFDLLGGVNSENGSFPPFEDFEVTHGGKRGPSPQNQTLSVPAADDELDDSFLAQNDVTRGGNWGGNSQLTRGGKCQSNDPKTAEIRQRASSPRAGAIRATEERDSSDNVVSSSLRKGSGETKRRATGLPGDLDFRDIGHADTAQRVARWPDGMIEDQWDRFRDWVADQGTTSKDWKARWRNWLRKADDDWQRQQRRTGAGRKGWAAVAARAAGAG